MDSAKNPHCKKHYNNSKSGKPIGHHYRLSKKRSATLYVVSFIIIYVLYNLLQLSIARSSIPSTPTEEDLHREDAIEIEKLEKLMKQMKQQKEAGRGQITYNIPKT
jgi:hypothetical protein